VRIVDDARDLINVQQYEAVFIVSRTIVRPGCPVADHQYLQRTDGSLVIWGDDEIATLYFWVDIICRLQRQSETAIPTTTSVAGLPGNDGINPEDTILWGNAPLPSLDELDYLSSTIGDNSPSWRADPQGYYEASSYPSWQQMANAEPLEGSIGVCVLVLCACGTLSPLSPCSLRWCSVPARHSAMPPPPLV
jgi:hypothetical protein